MLEKRALLLGLSGLLCTVGVVAFVWGWVAPRTDLVQGGGAVIAASLVALTTGVGLTSWADERRKARIEKQQAVYTDLVQQLVSRFGGSGVYDPAREGGLRAQVSTWGGTDVLKALGQWHEAYDDVVQPLVGSGGTITLPIQAADRMRTATAAVVTAVRAGIDPEDMTTVQEVADALFNQPDRPRGKL